MKLVSFSVQNFRSITTAHKLPIKDSTILIGPNNEGKSNILKALVLVLKLLGRFGITNPYRAGRIPRDPRAQRFRESLSSAYEWEQDFPISLQKTKPGKSIFNLDFLLTAQELNQFKSEVKSDLTGFLPVQISIGQKNDYDFKIRKQGRGARALSQKKDAIGKFISDRLDFEYIPSVRTAAAAQSIVEDMVARELIPIENNDNYKKALDEIERIQKPILNKLSANIKETLTEFLPAVRNVKVEVSREKRFHALRNCEITVDDGTPTLLRHKGDGVQSLAALSLMRHISERGARGRHLILAIEEPESHLHPYAIHQLKRVLNEMSAKHQIIITSHNPLFVDRQDVSSNIIVTGKKAIPAKSIAKIREVLGVRASDNLRNAELALIVEGEDDRIALSALLAHASTKLGEALRHGRLAIDSLLGASNLSYKIAQLRDVLCDSYAFLDYDQSGKDAARKAESEGLITSADVCYSICRGMSESEIEDMYNSGLYQSMIKNRYGVTLSNEFHANKKWSDRLRNVFRQQGKHWDDKIKNSVKDEVAKLIAENPADALNSHKRSAFDALVAALEGKLDAKDISMNSRNATAGRP